MKEGNLATEGDGRCLYPAIGRHPTDFIDTELDGLEKELGEFRYASDRWVYDYDTSKGINWENVDILTLEQREVKDWRDALSFPINETMGAHILNDLAGKQGAPNSAIVVETPERLSQQGS